MPFTISCTKCQKPLSVPDAAVGKKIRCPNCKEIIPISAPPQPSGADAVTATPAPAPPSTRKPAAPAPWDKEEEEEEIEEEEAPPPKKKKKEPENPFAFSDDGDANEERSPRKRRRRRDDEDDEDDEDDDDFADVPRRRPAAPHRGGTIVTLGILSIVAGCLCPLIAWIMAGTAISMANIDLAQMSVGRMDPAGRGNTQAGRLCAIIGIVIGLLAAIFFGVMNAGHRHR